jgi:3-mercaptopyruvate sulfurtransferase SseA
VVAGCLLTLLALLAGGGETSAQAPGPVPIQLIAPTAVIEAQQSGRRVQLVDVRARDEFDAAHIAGAINVPVPELERRYREVSRAGLVVLY